MMLTEWGRLALAVRRLQRAVYNECGVKWVLDYLSKRIGR